MKKIYQTIILLGAFSIAQSSTLYVDNVSNCAGNTTCYPSIQQAVNNASADDEIRVFPGIYAESVNISLMGSAVVTAANGNIKLITVDGNNVTTARTVQVSPAFGPAFFHSASFFLGNVEINGFTVLSLDDDGISFYLISGDIAIRNVTANGNDENGIEVAVATGNFTIDVLNSIANNNQISGLFLDGHVNTQVNVQNFQANNNIREGIDILSTSSPGGLNALISDSETLDNGHESNEAAGVLFVSRGSLDVKNFTSRNNHGPGMAIFNVTQTTITDSLFESNAIAEIYSGIFLVSAGTFSVERSVFSGNGLAGINVFETDVMGSELTSFSISCSNMMNNQYGIRLNESVSVNANYQINHNNFINQSVAGIHAELDNDSIDASGNWWGDVNGPTHINNPMGTGDRISDSLDAATGSPLGTVAYTPFLSSIFELSQFPPGTIFVDGFEDYSCPEL